MSFVKKDPERHVLGPIEGIEVEAAIGNGDGCNDGIVRGDAEGNADGPELGLALGSPEGMLDKTVDG